MGVRYSGSVLVVLATLMFTVEFSFAQASRGEAGEPVLQEIQSALARGDAEDLIERCGDRVDVTVFGASEVLSRSQSMYVMRDFFRRYQPARVVIEETSGSDGNWFGSARYWSKNEDAPLSVYLRMRLNEQRWELRELRIGRSNVK